jgi:hypothetical protein
VFLMLRFKPFVLLSHQVKQANFNASLVGWFALRGTGLGERTMAIEILVVTYTRRSIYWKRIIISAHLHPILCNAGDSCCYYHF